MSHRRRPSHRTVPRCAGFLGLLALAACGAQEDGVQREPPNVLFVVWDTTRADRMSLYGHERPTTPFLEEWARGARVFENCVATGSSTVPSHASMFTGLLPGEHGANNGHKVLDERHDTLAEIFSRHGYATYCFAANPHISRMERFTQGFDVEEHPWDTQNLDDAMRIQLEKLHPQDRSSRLPEKLRSLSGIGMWDIKACGEVGNRGLLRWLERREPGRPYFAFLNFMEAHRPFLPSAASRERLMTQEEIERSLAADRGWETMWSYTFGLHEYPEEDLEAMALTYDACILDLDGLFRDLVRDLEAGGHLENTIVVLVGDHGEHLGEHHMLDHQYSIYQGIVHVPLVLYDPVGVEPGRVSTPVSNYDVFPTLLELAGLPLPAGLETTAISLLEPRADRWRIAEYPSDFQRAIENVQRLHPEWDPAPFRRKLTGFYEDGKKLIWASDGTHELYDLESDPNEEHDLAPSASAEVERLEARLGEVLETLRLFDYEAAELPELDAAQRARLEALGYFGDEDTAGDEP